MLKRIIAIILVSACLAVCFTGCSRNGLPLEESDAGEIRELLQTALEDLARSESRQVNNWNNYGSGEGLKPEDFHFDEIVFMPTGYLYNDHVILPFTCQLSIESELAYEDNMKELYIFLSLGGVTRRGGVIHAENVYINVPGMGTGSYTAYLEEIEKYENGKDTEVISVPFGKVS